MIDDHIHFDMILFEQSRESVHHLKDLRIIAEMLQSVQVSVAILNIYGDYSQSDFPNTILLPKPISDAAPIRDKYNPIKEPIFQIRQYRYLTKVLHSIRSMANAFYIGSYDYHISLALLSFDKPFFVWGLRSFTFDLSLRKFLMNPLRLMKLVNKSKMIHNPSAHFFVSNDTIRKEFELRGMPIEKMIVRPERLSVGNEKTNYHCLSTKVRFLTIGWIREEKRVEKTIQAFKEVSCDENEFFIVGRSENVYENEIEKFYHQIGNIHRIRERLSDEDFNNHFVKSHFVCFADYSDPNATITNGTFVEALLHYRPVIAPDYEPFASIINKYKVGLLYNPNEDGSYVEALKRAQQLGTQSFGNSISEYLGSINYNVASCRLKRDIEVLF